MLKTAGEVVTSREITPYKWVFGPDEQWVYGGSYGTQFVHHPDKLITYHIGTSSEGVLVADSRVKEYARPHQFLGNVAIDELPTEVLRESLRASLDTRLVFEPRQRLIRALTAEIPGLCEVELCLPRPIEPALLPEGLEPPACVGFIIESVKHNLPQLRSRLGFNE